MTMPTARKNPFPLLKASVIESMQEIRRVHRLNPRAVRNGKSLGDAVGMTDMGIHLVRIKSGDETTEFHTHYCEEEFLFILSGRGIAEIGERKLKVGAGDFMGLPRARCRTRCPIRTRKTWFTSWAERAGLSMFRTIPASAYATTDSPANEIR